MSEQNTADRTEFDAEAGSPQWGDNAPKGGRAVLSRILKDGAKVPLFLGQTLINSLRDMGYNHTTSAICEHVDNAIQWGATEVRVYFHQTGKRGNYTIDTLVYDNGEGMSPHVLKVATAFGGSMVYENRSGIGRYGMGMKAAALSMSPMLDLYSWQEAGAIYNMTLDVEDIGSNRSNLVELPDAELIAELPSEVADILTRHMVFPKNPDDTQRLFASDRTDLREQLGNSGTIVFMPNCDRLTYRKAQTLTEHATKEMGRVYRRQIASGLRLYVNNRLVEAFDPTYWMPNARHAKIEGLETTQSRLHKSWQIDIPVGEHSVRTAPVSVRLYVLPFEEWGQLPRKVQKNDLRVFDDHTVSYLRNDREVEIGHDAKLKVSKHHTNNWLRVQIDFTGELDEAFGVAANKQGVRPKGYVYDKIVDAIGEELQSLRELIKRTKSEQAAAKSGSKVTEAERRATDTDTYQGKSLPIPAPQTEEEKKAHEANLRALAVGLKREHETDDEAYRRIESSTYVTVFKHDEYWPFYHCDFKYGKVILTINTAHPFFKRVWQPVSEIAKSLDSANDENGSADGVSLEPEVAAASSELLVALQLLLLSLARTQSQMTAHDDDGDNRQLFENLRTEWSANLKTQLGDQ